MLGHEGGLANFARERRVRNGAFTWMVTGIIVIKIATVWAIALLGTEDSASLPLAVAFLGLSVATVGFIRFVGYDRRTRFTRPLRSPDFETYLDGFFVPHPNRSRSQHEGRSGEVVRSSSCRRDFLNRN